MAGDTLCCFDFPFPLAAVQLTWQNTQQSQSVVLLVNVAVIFLNVGALMEHSSRRDSTRTMEYCASFSNLLRNFRTVTSLTSAYTYTLPNYDGAREALLPVIVDVLLSAQHYRKVQYAG